MNIDTLGNKGEVLEDESWSSNIKIKQTLDTLKEAARINTTCYATNTLYYEPGGTLVGVLISKELCDFIKQMECDDECQK